MPKQLSQQEITDIKSRAQDLKARYASRDAMFKELEDMYLLNYKEFEDEDYIKETTSPDPRNSLQGMVRLMTATSPQWSVPHNANSPMAGKASSEIEKLCAIIWAAANQVSQKINEKEVALAALLYSEIQVLVYDTEELAAAIKNPGDRKQAEEAAKRTPLMFEVVNPLAGFADIGLFGMRAYYTEQDMTVSDVRSRWGEDVLVGKKTGDHVTYCDWWDSINRLVWVDGEDAPLWAGAHEKDNIPIVVAIAEGSTMFKREGQMDRQPVLYTAWKTNIWKRMNDALTVVNTMAFNLGRNPMYVWKRNSPDKESPTRDHDVPGGLIVIEKDEDYQALAKQLVDPSILQVYEIGQEKMTESTIYRQALGEPLSGNAPFSMVAMLSQAGRLPLVPYQKMASFAIGRAMQIGLQMLKKKNKKLEISSQAGEIEFDMAEIPENFNLVCNLDIAMPQDQRQNVALATQATQGDDPLLSKRYAREEFLNVGQSDDMDREIQQERFIKAQMDMQYQRMMQQLQMEFQQMMQQQSQQALPQQGQQPALPAGGEQIPPEMLAQLSQTNQGAEPGMPGIPMAAPMGAQGEAPMPGGGMPPEGMM